MLRFLLGYEVHALFGCRSCGSVRRVDDLTMGKK